MTLLDLCEPLFQYVCMLNRIARSATGEGMEYAALRPAIDSIFETMDRRAEREPPLKVQYDKLREPLVFFIDSIIAESKLSLAPVWNKQRIAYEQKELAGDEKFFDLLDRTLEDPSPDADERLAVFYVCMGLGFTGWYTGQSEYLRSKMNIIAGRIKKQVETNRTARLNPEAYDNLDTRNLIQPPGVKLAAVATVFLAGLFVVLGLNFYLFHTASRGLSDALREILTHDMRK
jgi:type IV/VI secretion system ImpK/VasF family protein